MSKPLQLYKHKINIYHKIMDYGSGRGEDTKFLREEGYAVFAYDKHFTDTTYLIENTYDIVMCNYVLNVIPSIEERLVVLHDIKDLLVDDGVAYITVRPMNELDAIKYKQPYKDGWLTGKGTFQKFYEIDEFMEFVSSVFGDVRLFNKNPLIVEVNK